MVVVVNVFGVAWNQHHSRTVRDLMTTQLALQLHTKWDNSALCVMRLHLSMYGQYITGMHTDLVVLECVQAFPVALDNGREVFVR